MNYSDISHELRTPLSILRGELEGVLESIEPVIVLGDADRLTQLFSNLLENTLRYADVSARLKIWHSRGQNRLTIYIEDSGPGVPEKSLGHLFDRLYRVDKSRSRSQGGSRFAAGFSRV